VGFAFSWWFERSGVAPAGDGRKWATWLGRLAICWSLLTSAARSEGLRDLAAGPRRDFGSYGRINIGDPCGLVLLGFRLLAWKLAPVCRFRKKMEGIGLLTPAFTKLSILGSTGSIGRQCLSVVEALPDRFTVVAMAAGGNLGIGRPDRAASAGGCVGR